MSARQAIVVVIVMEAAVALLAIMSYGVTMEGLQAVARFSGRLSLFLFTFIFLFHLQSTVNLKKWMSPRYFLIFAIAHGIHLAELIAFMILANRDVVPVRLAGGMLAYGMILGMPFLEQRLAQGQIPQKRFDNISLIYIYYIWFVFFMTYLPRVRGTLPDAGGSYKEFVVLLGWVSIILGFKVSQVLSNRIIKVNKDRSS